MITQYVNLPLKASEHHGSRLVLEAEAKALGDEKLAYTEWWVEPVGADNVDPKYLSNAQRARVLRLYVANKKGKFRNTIYLPHVGGDTYKVCCSKKGDRSSPLQFEEIKTWRKILYTVHWMNQDCKDTFNAVQARFETALGDDGFIEMKQAKLEQTLVDEPKTLATKAELPHLYKAKPALPDKPFHMRIVVLNDIYDLTSNEYNETGVASKVTVIPTQEPLSDLTPTHFKQLVQARVEPGGAWVNVSAHAKKLSDTEVEIDVSGVPKLSKAIDKGKTLALRLRTRERDHYNGHSLGNFCCVRIRGRAGTAAEVERSILQTFVHEAGHGFGQARRREPLFDAAGNFTKKYETNALWHNDKFGGRGPHCHHNAVLVPVSKKVLKSGQMYDCPWCAGLPPVAAGNLCVMFFRADPHRPPDGKFCPTCKPRLRRAALDAKAMAQRGWSSY